MIKVIKANWGFEKPIWEFTCSSTADIASLPTSTSTEEPYKKKGVGVGSTCICTENHSKYMLGADDKWHKIKTYTVEADAPSGYTITINNTSDPETYGADAWHYSIDDGITWIGINEPTIVLQNVTTVLFRDTNQFGGSVSDASGKSLERLDSYTYTYTATEDTTLELYISW